VGLLLSNRDGAVICADTRGPAETWPELVRNRCIAAFYAIRAWRFDQTRLPGALALEILGQCRRHGSFRRSTGSARSRLPPATSASPAPPKSSTSPRRR